jgi:hypothetical protein
VSALSQAGVDHLASMKRLQTLVFIDLAYLKPKHQPTLDVIISVAGQVPSLQNFGFRVGQNHNKFIEEFAKKYPLKELIVDQMT